MSNDWQPFGGGRDSFEGAVGLSLLLQGIDNARTASDVAKIRALLEREANKGNAKAKAIEELVRKYTCCTGGKHDLYKPCLMCCKSGMILESEVQFKVQFKDRMRLEPIMQPCQQCRGSGSTDGRTACHICNGTGKENLYGSRDGDRIARISRPPNPYDSRARDPIVYKCPQCNGTGRYCEFCQNTGIALVRRAEYERELKRIEERYR